jgi:hypothetical protein
VIVVGILFTVLLIALASYVALMNFAGTYLAIQRKRKGISGGYSCVPLVSLMLCLMAVAIAYDTLGLLPLIPALIDPGTWTIVVMPFFLLWMVFKRPDP